MTGITNPAEAFFKDGVWGWDGATWRKLPLVFGYTSRWAEYKYGVASDTGDAVTTTTAVPVGFIYVLQAFMINHNAETDRKMFAGPVFDDEECDLLWLSPATKNVVYTWSGEVLLEPGDVFRATVDAPGNTKRVYLRVWGYKMRISD